MVIKDNNNLNIYVINKGLGESIIIKTPDGKWGIIDCYTSNLKNATSNPVLKLLEEHKVKEIEFVVLTHPHNDHYRGMSQIFKEYNGRIKFFWRFAGISPKLLKWLKLRKVDIKKIKSNTLGENISDLNILFSEIRKQKKNMLNLGFLIAGQTIYQSNNIQISVIAPNGNVIESFDESLQFSQNLDLPFGVAGSGNENRVSGIIRIKYGDRDYLLFSDSDNYAQKELFKEIKANKTKFDPVFIKVSHHGSKEGYYEDLWKQLGFKKETTDSVITPYLVRKLPRKDIIAQVSNASKLHVPVPVKDENIERRLNTQSKTIFSLISYKNYEVSKASFGILAFEYDKTGKLINLMKGPLSV
nr:MBL fold metallo-hydrolase [uncultured Desulfobacter sp.]